MSRRISEEAATQQVADALGGHMSAVLADLVIECLQDEVSALLWRVHKLGEKAPLVPVAQLRTGLPAYTGPLRTIYSPDALVLTSDYSSARGAERLLSHIAAMFPLIERLDLENLLIAGGAVTKCLIRPEGAHAGDADGIPSGIPDDARRDIENVSGPGDVDIFVYGLDAQGAHRKAAEVFELAKEYAGSGPLRHIITAEAITIEIDKVRYQIILRLHKDPAECLRGFDLGSCAVGVYRSPDGELRAETTLLGAFALERRANIADTSRHHPAYGNRILKYNCRGFGFVLPDASNYAALRVGKSFVSARAYWNGRQDAWVLSDDDKLDGSGGAIEQFGTIALINSGTLPRVWSTERELRPSVMDISQVEAMYEALADEVPNYSRTLAPRYLATPILRLEEVQHMLDTAADDVTRIDRIQRLLRAQGVEAARQTFKVDLRVEWATATNRRSLTLEEFYGSSLRESFRLLGPPDDEKQALLAAIFGLEAEERQAPRQQARHIRRGAR